MSSVNITWLTESARQSATRGDSLQALTAYQRILSTQPCNHEALHYTGVLLVEFGQAHRGLPWIERSLEKNRTPTAIFLTNKGIALHKTGNIKAAVRVLNDALRVDPYYVLCLLNLGDIYQDEKNFDVAVSFYHKILVIDPSYQAAHARLVNCYSYPDQLAMRVGAAERAHTLTPSSPEAAYLLGLYYLLIGVFDRGWDLMSYRWDVDHLGIKECYTKYLSSSQPVFDPECPKYPVFLWAEQGLGDEIMFLSMLKEFIDDHKTHIIIEVDARMLQLWKRSFTTVNFIPRGRTISEGQYEAHLPLGDLPSIYRRTSSEFNKGRPYLLPDEALLKLVSDKLRIYKKPIIGLGWYSSNGDTRCIPLTELVRVVSKFDVTIVSLQYGDTKDAILECEQNLGKQLFTPTGVDCTNDLDKLAALIAECDLVISVANSTVHLAGALGVKTWGLLPFFPGWRWLSEGSDCLWYPSVKLFRQDTLHDWGGTLRAIEVELGTFYGITDGTSIRQ